MSLVAKAWFTTYDVADPSPIENASLRVPYPLALSNIRAPFPVSNVSPEPLFMLKPLSVLTFTSTAPPVFIREALPEVGVTSTLNTVPFRVSPDPAV
jgi:hypothetical protein